MARASELRPPWSMTIFWIIVAAACLIAELLTLAIFALFLAIGMAGAALASALGAPTWAQVAIAVGLPIPCLVFLRPQLLSLTSGHRGRVGVLPGQTLVGMEAMSIDQIGDEHHPGHVMLSGERWLATTEVPAGVPPGTRVTVVGVRGTTLVVWP